MKTHRLTLCAASLCAMIAACERMPEPGPAQDEMTPLEITVKATDGIQTRGIVTGTSLGSGSQIGLSIYDSSDSGYLGKYCENIRYTASGTGDSQKWNADSPIMVSNTAGTLYGYYPYSSSHTDMKKIAITATSDNQTDYMYATPVSNVTKANSSVAVVMNHALAAVRLSVSKGTYSGSGKVTAVSVSGGNVPTTAKLNIRTGAISSRSGYHTEVAPAISQFYLSSTPTDIDILTIPSSSSSVSLNVSITIDGFEYTTVIENVNLQQGTMSECQITVDNGKVNVQNVSVKAWKETLTANQTIQKNYNVTMSGDYEGISINHEVSDDGIVTIYARTDNHVDTEVKPVTITGEATLNQSLDADAGILTITLSDIASDVDVKFNSYDLWVRAVYNVTSIASETKLGGSSYNTKYISRMKVDGEEVTPAQYHLFSTTGEHEVKYSFTTQNTIPSNMFSSLNTVKSVYLPEGITTINSVAFQNNTSIETVNFPNSLRTLGYQVFNGCSSLSCPFVFSENLSFSYGIFSGCSKLTDVTLASNTKTIPSSMFSQCTALKQLVIPSSVTKIDYGAFGSSGITSISIPDGVSVIPEGVFKNCYSLEEIRLPASLKEIQDQAFMKCTALRKVTLADGTVCTEEFIVPEGVTTIGEMVFFFDSPYIKAVRIPSTLVNAPTKGFANPTIERFTMTNANPKYDIRNHSVIETATNTLVGLGTQGGKIHESVTAIGEYACYMTEAEKLDFHAGLLSIGSYAFDSAYPHEIICRAVTPPTLGSYTFRIAYYNGTLKIPEEAMNAYKSTWLLNQVGYLGWTTARWSVKAIAAGE